jgi:hypothetical protein
MVHELVRRLRRWLPARGAGWAVGTTGAAHARRLADAEHATGAVPDGCAWLDARTVDDLELPRLFEQLDRTVTPTGAQALWRWMAAPATRLEVLSARERALARLAADPSLRSRTRAALAGQATASAPHLPRLLWEPMAAPLPISRFAALAALVVALAALAALWPPLALAAVAVFFANVLIDDWASLRTAWQVHALDVLAGTLDAAHRLIAPGLWRDEAIAADLRELVPLRKRARWLTAADPIGLADLVRGGLLARLLIVGGAMRMVDRERARLRRVVLWLGERDALTAIAALRAERADARLPALSPAARAVAARGLVHPGIAGAIGNDVTVDGGLLLTGSNMSGKSTFLRTVAVNAICAQSIHTTFGAWRAPLVRPFAAMRSADDPAEGLSRYAVEVAAIGYLIEEVARRDHDVPALLVIDEPFGGTNPAVRVPIVVAVLDHLGDRDLVLAATHDLDVAAGVDARFARGYFAEPDDGSGRFDYQLRPGVSPGTNALALLARAGYPAAILEAVERRVRPVERAAR